jgi:hypothetical protein
MRKKKYAKRRNQPRIPGIRRIAKNNRVHPKTERALETFCNLFGVSPAWVQNYALERFLYGSAKYIENPRTKN